MSTTYHQTELQRLHQYVSAPFSRYLSVQCVWCGQDAGRVNLLDIVDSQLWIKRGKLCPPCYDKQMVETTDYA